MGPARLAALLLSLSLTLVLEPSARTQSSKRLQNQGTPSVMTATSPRIGMAQIAGRGTGDTDWWVKEADIAAGNGRALAVFIHGALPTPSTVLYDPSEIRYAFFDGRVWTEGSVDDTLSVAGDPVVVHDEWNDRFVIAYFRTDGLSVQQDLEKPVWVRVFDPRTERFVGTAPTLALPNRPGPGFHDKPWLVAGRSTASCQELVITTFFDPDGLTAGGLPFLSYARSVDGGSSWTVGTPLDQNGVRMRTLFAPQPAIPDAGPGAPFYLVTRKAARWVLWESRLGDPSLRAPLAACEPSSAAPVFERLGVSHDPVLLNDFINSKVPGTGKMVRVPYLIADPTSRDRLYLLFTDGRSPNGGNMEVFCLRFQRDPATGTWTKSAPVQVNDNPATDGTDQFTPAAVVDERGRLHVLFYDGRRYANGGAATGCNGPGAKYDATYAVSEDHGATFRNYPIPTFTGEPVICEDLPAARQPPGEYPGIAVDGDQVWVAFAGTSHKDTTADHSVVWAARIEVP